MRKCSKCGLINIDTVEMCDCGWGLDAGRYIMPQVPRLYNRGGCLSAGVWILFVFGCLIGLVTIGQLIALACGVEEVGAMRFPVLLILITGYFLFRRARTPEEIERRGRCIR